MKSLALVVLCFFLMGSTSCEKKRKQATQKAVAAHINNGAAAPDCSMAGHPNLDRALDINARLANTVQDVSQSCKTATQGLNMPQLETLRGHFTAAREQRRTKRSLIAQIRDLDRDLNYYKSKNNPAYDALIDQYKSQLDVHKADLKARRYTEDADLDRRRDSALYASTDIAANYAKALESCRASDPKIVTSVVQSGVALASSLGGMASGGALAAQLIAKLASQISESIPTLETRLQADLSSSRAPYTTICAVEAVTQVYCASLREMSEPSPSYSTRRCNCHLKKKGLKALSQFRPMLDKLKAMYPLHDFNKRLPSGMGEDSARPPIPQELAGKVDASFAAAQNEKLHESIGSVEQYLKAVEADAKASRSPSRRIALKEVQKVRSQVAKIKQKQATEDLTEIATVFQNKEFDLYASMKTVSQLHQNVMKSQIRADLKSGRINAIEEASVMQFLSASSSQMSLDQVQANMVKTPTLSQADKNQRYLAHNMAKQNVSQFSQFVDKNVQIDKIIDSVLQNSRDGGKYDKKAANGVVAQLCAASLSLYTKPGSFPQSIVKRCGNHSPVKNMSYASLANQHHEKRACIAQDMNFLGSR